MLIVDTWGNAGLDMNGIAALYTHTPNKLHDIRPLPESGNS